MSRRALAAYPTLEAVHDEASRFGDPFVYGTSVAGRPLRAYSRGEGDTTVWVTAGLHGLEYIGVATALEVLRSATPPGVRMIVRPVLNPDAYARTRQQHGSGSVASMRRNENGIDLNRNFPLPYGAHPSRLPFAGASSPSSATYRGPSPASEPETRALMTSQREEAPNISLNLHSFMGTLIPARTWTWREWRQYGAIARAFRGGQGGLGYRRLATPVFDVFTGELEDWQHHEAGCWAVCIECYSLLESFLSTPRPSSVFERFNPRDPSIVAMRDARGVLAVAAIASTLTALRRPHQIPEATVPAVW